MRRKIPPIPLEIIMDDPRVIALPAAGRGMLNNLVWHFWITECRELPKSNASLFSIADAHPSTWSKFKPDILAIMAEAMPALVAARELREKHREALSKIQQRGTGSTKLASLARKAKREARILLDADEPRLSEPVRAARVIPPSARVERGFSQRLARTG